MRKYLQGILFVSFGVLILFLVYRSQEAAYAAQCTLDSIPEEDCSLLEKIFRDFRSIKIPWLLLVLLMFLISNVARSLRWKQLIRGLGKEAKFFNAFFCIALGYFANLGLPRVGEFVRAGSMAKYEDITADKLMGTVATDRILDLLCMGSIFLLGFFLEYDLLRETLSTSMSFGMESPMIENPLLFLGILGLVFLLIAWLFKLFFSHTKLYKKILSLLTGFWEGVKSVGKVKNPFLFIVYTVVIWGAYFLMTYLCFETFAPVSHLGLRAGLIVFIFGSLGIVIPSPGGMGTFHFLTISALAIYGIAEADAFSFANILFFSIQISFNIVVGIIALLALPWLNRPASDKVS